AAPFESGLTRPETCALSQPNLPSLPGPGPQPQPAGPTAGPSPGGQGPPANQNPPPGGGGQPQGPRGQATGGQGPAGPAANNNPVVETWRTPSGAIIQRAEDGIRWRNKGDFTIVVVGPDGTLLGIDEDGNVEGDPDAVERAALAENDLRARG